MLRLRKKWRDSLVARRARACGHTIGLRGFPFAAKFESRLKKQRSALLHKVVKESQWELIAPSLPAGPGIQDDRRPTTGSSAKPCSGSPAPVHHLESCLPALPPLDFKGGFESLFEDLYGDPDFEYAIIDGTIVRVRQHGIGAKGARKIRPLALRPEERVAWPPRSSQCDALRQSRRLRSSARRALRQRRGRTMDRENRMLCASTRPSKMIGGHQRRHPAEGRPCPRLSRSLSGRTRLF
jgi:hypothetical protein